MASETRERRTKACWTGSEEANRGKKKKEEKKKKKGIHYPAANYLVTAISILEIAA